MRRLRLFALLLLLLPLQSMAAAGASTDFFTARLVPESRTPAPGQALALALVITPQAGWHTYWKNPGQTGLPPRPSWQLPDGFTAGPLRYPVPTELDIGGLASNVYAGRSVLLADIQVPKTVHRGAAIPVGLALHLLVCSESRCVPQKVSLALSLTAGNGAPDRKVTALFHQARAALPAPLGRPAAYRPAGKAVQLLLPLPRLAGVTAAQVFFDGDTVVPADKQTWRRDGDRLAVRLPRDALPRGNKALNGVVRVTYNARSGPGKTVRGYRFSAAPAPAAPASPPAAAADTGFLLALGGAILGGLLLNLMPCVFPILSLKALALARAGGDEREVRREAAGYTLGTMGVLIALGAVVIALKSAGHAAGWAFQLQDPRTVAVLLLLVTAIAANLAGLYELPSLPVAAAQRTGFWGGLGAGALAAFIATPCTGPFMAGALGAALLLPTAAALAVFAGLGLGLALPFLGLGYIAPLRRLLPRPGAWMLTLRRLLSLPMFAAALWLAWIIGREGGVAAMTLALGAALLLGLALWWYGLRRTTGRSGVPALLPVAAALLLALTGTVTPANTGTADARLLHSRPYSAALLEKLRAQKRPVFVYLTADWCLSCKVNEATTLSSAAVARAFSHAHVAVLKGDWTRGDPKVGRLLAREDRAGVPLYLWYDGGGPPRILPQVLTPSMLIQLAGNAATEKPAG